MFLTNVFICSRILIAGVLLFASIIINTSLESEKLSVFLDALKKRGINPLFLPIFSNKIKVSYRCALLILNYHNQDFLGKQKHCFHLI